MKQVLLKSGQVYTMEIPRPQVEKDMVLVKTKYSCISAGTELSGLASSGASIFQKIAESPELVSLGINMLKESGIKETWKAVKGTYTVDIPMGYSAAGVVEESGTSLFVKGDKVACMGVNYANHAGYILVPKNLVAKIPDNVSYEIASTAALGCIAMQGIRRANIKLGEYVVVAGMGILGQLTCRLAMASGATVIATDIDNRRLNIAKDNGASYIVSVEDDIVKRVNEITGGYGADSVIITASTNSDVLLSQSFNMCRQKGKVVLVGVTGMNINRNDMYKKELELLIATSYGPGRYDENYEERGNDYPYGYVRFTEKRNLESYLRLISLGRINITDIIEKIYPVEEAKEAYESLKTGDNRPLIVLIKYFEDMKEEESPPKKIDVEVCDNCEKNKKKILNIALCGAGGFAKTMHIPNILKMKDMYQLYAVQSRTGSNAEGIARANNAKYSTTNYNQVLCDAEVDVVMICTRHNLHASMVIDAIRAKKAVFVEKPLALTSEETDLIVKLADEKKIPLIVGYNRRFSRYAQEAKKIVRERNNPMIIMYRINAGFIPKDNWIQTEEGGGRIVGEGCHIFDLFNFLTDSKAESISVNQITPKTETVLASDNCAISVKYEDGSLCTLIYTGQGNKEYGKEFCEIFVDGKVIVIDDYKKFECYGEKNKNFKTRKSEKGQAEELQFFYNCIKSGEKYPIPLWQIEQATKLSIMGQVIQNKGET